MDPSLPPATVDGSSARDGARSEAELAASRGRAGAEPQPLWGIATADDEVDDILRDARRAVDTRLDAKLGEIADTPACLDPNALPPASGATG